MKKSGNNMPQLNYINSKEKLSRRRFIKNVSSAAAISSLILPVSGCSQKMS